MQKLQSVTFVLVAVAGVGCEEIPEGAEGGGGATGTPSGTGGSPFAEGVALEVPTAPGPAFVDLDGPAVVDESSGWELKLQGTDVFTNGGASGMGQSKAFGPLEALQFLTGTVPPDIPFLIEDEPGGAFLEWFKYDSTSHAVFSRYHVIGVRRGAELFKVQVLGYYGEEQGAPVSALYQVRSSRVNEAGSEPTTLWEDIDATAGGTSPTDGDPSGCIVLGSGARLALTPSEAASSAEWDLCFRRTAISVNGGDGGPGGVEAVNLQGASLAGESLEEVKARTAASELAAFEAVGHAQLTAPGLDWRGDGIVSAFTGKWIDRTVDPPVPAEATWIVAGSDGETPFFVAFESFEGATTTSAGTVRIRVKKIGGSLP